MDKKIEMTADEANLLSNELIDKKIGDRITINGLGQIEIICSACLGEGEVPSDEDDGEGHVMRGVGIEKCICKIHDGE